MSKETYDPHSIISSSSCYTIMSMSQPSISSASMASSSSVLSPPVPTSRVPSSTTKETTTTTTPPPAFTTPLSSSSTTTKETITTPAFPSPSSSSSTKEIITTPSSSLSSRETTTPSPPPPPPAFTTSLSSSSTTTKETTKIPVFPSPSSSSSTKETTRTTTTLLSSSPTTTKETTTTPAFPSPSSSTTKEITTTPSSSLSSRETTTTTPAFTTSLSSSSTTTKETITTPAFPSPSSSSSTKETTRTTTTLLSSSPITTKETTTTPAFPSPSSSTTKEITTTPSSSLSSRETTTTTPAFTTSLSSSSTTTKETITTPAFPSPSSSSTKETTGTTTTLLSSSPITTKETTTTPAFPSPSSSTTKEITTTPLSSRETTTTTPAFTTPLSSSSTTTKETITTPAFPSPSSSSSTKETTATNNICQIMKWILNQICFRGLRILIDLEMEFPNIESSLSSGRLDFFTKIINIACNTSYDKAIICAIHNVINMNESIKKELFGKIDMNELFTQYQMLHTNDLPHIDKNLIKIMPFTNECTNTQCQREKLDIIFSRTGHILYSTSIKSCSIYTATCKVCKCIYEPSSILDVHANRRIVTVHSIQNINYICFSGNIVYTKELLTMFSNYLIHAHVSFEGFAQSYTATLEDLQINYISIFSANAFAKRLEITWIYYELSRFIFVTSRENYVIFPRFFQPEKRSIFIEQNLRFLSHLFSVFWSHHQMINEIKCKQSSCSRVMLIDGHQKCRRIICKFPNVTNMSHPEMGPVLHGCPYAPKRRKKDQSGTDDESVFYCSHHGRYIKSVDDLEQLDTHEYNEAFQIDQQIIADLNNENMCNVYRNELEKDQKNRSFGVLVTFLSCNVIVGFNESIKSEGCRRVTDHLLTMLKDGAQLPDSLIYDNACALHLHWNKVYGSKYLEKTEFTNKLYNLVLALDRFHRKGHVRPMCKKLMNPDDDQHGNKFKQINTSVCEQFFSFLTKFRFALRGFNYPTSSLFTLLLFHLKNCHTTGIKTSNFGLGRKYFNDKIQDHFINPCIFESVTFDINEKQRHYQWKEDEPSVQNIDSEHTNEVPSEDIITDEESSEDELDAEVETDPETINEDSSKETMVNK